jgi:hypothetical protein
MANESGLIYGAGLGVIRCELSCELLGFGAVLIDVRACGLGDLLGRRHIGTCVGSCSRYPNTSRRTYLIRWISNLHDVGMKGFLNAPH